MRFNMRHFAARRVSSDLDALDSAQNTSPEVKEAAMNIHEQAIRAEKDASGDTNGSADSLPDKEAQEGVQQVEAITLVWTRKSLILTYAFILLIYFVNSLDQQMVTSLVPYVTSNFALHSLLATVSVVSNILGGVLQLPTAKLIDTWGRPKGFAIMIFLCTVGQILMAVCRNVQTFAAAQVFYSVGFSGIIYVLEVIVADTSSLRSRAAAIAVSQSPYIITAFVAPIIAQAFYHTTGFRWAFGCFAIVVPLTSVPIWGILLYHQRKAEKQGLLVKIRSGRSVLQSTWYYLVEFDAVGILIIGAGLVLFLIPFSLIGIGANTWESANIIVMIVIGVILIIAFGLWERFLAPKAYIPFRLLVSGNILGAIILLVTTSAGCLCWAGYFTSFLQVVNGLTISQAGYVANIYNVGSSFFAIIAGLLIHATGRFKWLAWVGLLIQLLGSGLMIYFRQPNRNVGYVCMCQILISFGAGALYMCGDMAVMSVAKHRDIATFLALVILSLCVGYGIGSSISGGIWANTLPEQLALWLPDYAQGNLTDIYSSLDVQLSYPVGDPVRDAIVKAYGVAQQRMCTAGTACFAIGFFAVAMWKDIKVKDIKQVKGTIF